MQKINWLDKLKSPYGIVIGIVFLWHLQVGLFSKNTISGIFMTKPAKPGFVWADAKNTESRFFWANTESIWKEDIEHPDFKVVSGKRENLWNPAPGYVFIDESKGLECKWQAGEKHPNFMAFADDAEGKFVPATGYKFVYDSDPETFADCVWDPNQRYEDRKLISLEEKDTFSSFPGYRFTDPDKNLDVAWTPGMVNSDNPKLIAGQKEGSWEVNVKPVVRYTNSSDEVSSEFVRRAFWYAF